MRKLSILCSLLLLTACTVRQPESSVPAPTAAPSPSPAPVAEVTASPEPTAEISETVPDSSLMEMRQYLFPAGAGVGYIGFTPTEQDLSLCLDTLAMNPAYAFVKDIPADRIIGEYTEDTIALLIVPQSETDTVAIDAYDLENNEIGEVLYHSESGEPVILLMKDLCGDPTTAVYVTGDLDLSFCPAISCMNGRVRTGDTSMLAEITPDHIQRPMFAQICFDHLMNVPETAGIIEHLEATHDRIIDGHYYTIYECDVDDTVYAVRPDTPVVLVSEDWDSWMPLNEY